MKKSAIFYGLVAILGLGLTACSNQKDYNMSFEEALDTANHSVLQDVLVSTENFQQTFDVSTNLEKDWSKLIANLRADSNQNLNNSKSEFDIDFDVNVNQATWSLNITWWLDIKSIDDVIYLNLESLWISWSEDTSFLAAMLEWFTNQWYFVSMTWLSDVPSSLSYLKDAKELNNKAKDIFVNEGSLVYSWKFSQFNWYNAWKFSLDNEKLQELVNEYYALTMVNLEEDSDIQDVPQVNVQSFDWYLVITWKDKVTTVIDNMQMVDNGITIDVDGFGWDDYQINLYQSWESIASILATKKWSDYKVSLNASDIILVDWIVTPKISTSSIYIKFDVNVTIESQYENWEKTVLPLKWSWTYKPISEFSVETPENAQDLSELISSYLWWIGGESYYDGFEDYDEVYLPWESEVISTELESISE